MQQTGRHTGVKVPDGQLRQNERSESPHYSILGFAPIQMAGVKYVDIDGKVKEALAVKVQGDDTVYFAKNGEAWIRELGPVVPRMQSKLSGLFGHVAPSAPAPGQDDGDDIPEDDALNVSGKG